MNNDDKKLSIALPGEWALQKVLGPILGEIGGDLKTLYASGRDKITQAAARKVTNLEDGAKANLRVARDVFWNGSYTDESICAEYFGGILAASRSSDGKNDSGVFYVDIIKSLSSGQLKMHYIIYRTLNKELIANDVKKDLNPGQETDLGREQLYIPLNSLDDQLKGEDLGAILHGLHAQGLIGTFQTDIHKLGEETGVRYLEACPSPLGVQLFAIANNKFADWRNYSNVDFGDFEDIVLPQYYGQSMDQLCKRAGIDKPSLENNVPAADAPTK